MPKSENDPELTVVKIQMAVDLLRLGPYSGANMTTNPRLEAEKAAAEYLTKIFKE